MSQSPSRAGAMALVCVVATATAAAQKPQARFGVGVGVTAPTGDYHADQFGDGFGIGWQGVAVVDYRVSERPMGFRANASYGENNANAKFRTDLTADIGQASDAKVKMLGGDVDLTYNFRRARSGAGGYLLGGIGLYRATLSVIVGNISADTTETKFAWNVGGGLNVPVARATMFVELRYCSVATAFGISKLAFFPVTAGLRLGGK